MTLLKPDAHSPSLLPRRLLMRPGAFGELTDLIPADVRGIALVADRRVMDLYGKTVLDHMGDGFGPVIPLSFEPGEASKTLNTMQDICSAMLRAGLDRRSMLLALGGGVATDLGAFAAHCYMRGIGCINLPTTIVGAVDAAMGGKCGVNLPEAKNTIGGWLQPHAVIIDTSTFATLPPREIRNGMGEILKAAVVGDAELFALIDKNAVGLRDGELPSGDMLQRAVAVKTAIVTADPYEQGIRAGLNFGHSIGHALELCSDFALAHGEAVACGMVLESRIAVALGHLSAHDADRIAALVAALGFDTRARCPVEEALVVLRRDKKNQGQTIRMALPQAIGRMYGTDEHPTVGTVPTVAVEESLIREVWDG